MEIWKVKNHGGDPTTNVDKKRAIFIGRYQPYHYGHINLINQKLRNGIPVLIMVRDIEPDDKNPLTTEQTIEIIEMYHKLNNDDVMIMSIPDIESVNYGRGVGYEINEYTPPSSSLESFISATHIRNCIKSGDDSWREMVPETIQDIIKKYIHGNI
jgi:cytidyltransferase-like protein